MAPKRCTLSVLLVLAYASCEYVTFANAAEHVVVVGPGLSYDPKFLEINAGDTVVWKWVYLPVGAPKAPHTVTRSLNFDKKCLKVDDRQKRSRGIDFHSGVQLSGFEFRHTFNRVETVTYHCETTPANCFPGGMWGQIKVVPWGAQSARPNLNNYQMTANTMMPGFVGGAIDDMTLGLSNLLGNIG